MVSAHASHGHVGFIRKYVDRVKQGATSRDSSGKALLAMLMASLVVLVASGTLCSRKCTSPTLIRFSFHKNKTKYLTPPPFLLSDKFECEGNVIWGVVLGATSAGLSLIFLLLPRIPCKWVAGIILAVMWLLGVGLLTFEGPFVDTSNGFFACWVGFLASFVWAFSEVGKRFPVARARVVAS